MPTLGQGALHPPRRPFRARHVPALPGRGAAVDGVRAGDADARRVGVRVLDVREPTAARSGVPRVVPGQVRRQVSEGHARHDPVRLVAG